MAYNKAKEEKKWRLWKEAEEKQLTKFGVDESTIETLDVYKRQDYYRPRQAAGSSDNGR